MNQKNQTLQLVKELNQYGEDLKTKINDLLIGVNSYIENYCDETFVDPQIINDEDGKITKDTLKKGEAVFDRIQESLLRNNQMNELGNIVEQISNTFNEKIIQFNRKIIDDYYKLIETNNEVLDNLKDLERKVLKSQLKENNNEINKELLENILETDIEMFKRETKEEQEHNNYLSGLINEMKGNLKLKEMKQLEEWIDLPIERIFFDSET